MKRMFVSLRSFGSYLLISSLCMLAVSGCTRTLYVPVQSVVRDTIYDSRQRADTVIALDSIYERVAGDTVVREVYRWRVKSRLRVDTLYRSRIDTVPVVVTEYVEKIPAKKSARSTFKSVLNSIVVLTRVCFITVLLGILVRFLWNLRRR